MKIILQISAVGSICAFLLSCAAGTETTTIMPEPEAITQAEGEEVTPEAVTLTEGQVVSSVGTPEQITVSGGDNGLACIHPDGSRLVFQSNRDGRWQIYELNLEDRYEQQLIFSEFNDENPVWTEDGTGIIFVSDRDGGEREWERDIYFHDVATAEVTRLTESAGDDWYPVAAANNSYLYLSEQIVDDSTPYYKRQARLMRGYLDGTPADVLIEKDVDPATPVEINPSSLVYRNSEGQLSIYSTSLRQSRELTPVDLNCGSPCYNPANGWLAFNSATAGNILYVMDLQGDVTQTIDVGGEEVRYPQFIPDGRGIVYTAKVDGKFQLFSIELTR